ncbi:MAG: glycosyltransferase family 2 protein [Anaerolineae bacterium]|nr:glycosyltransferase family 2 protein [Anaerolineae bacterium]
MQPEIPASESTEKNPIYQVALVITNWNGRHYLEACLGSIFTQEIRDFVVFVVDNASTDDSVEWVQTHYPQVRLIQNEANLGLCVSNNRGILATKAEFVAILNNDTEFEPDWLARLVQAIRADPQIGMCACKMLLTDRRDMIESAGIVVDKAGIAWGLESGRPDRLAEPITPVFGACGGAALYRRSMLLEIGLFDEDFFVYLEDADVAWRGQWAGWKCVYVPQAIAYHAHSATIKEGSPFKTRLLGRNKIWLICKNYPLPHLIWYSPLILLYELMSIGYNVASGRGFYALKGRLEAMRQLPRMLIKRRRIVRRISAREMMSKLHPLGNPFALLRSHLDMFRAAKSGQYNVEAGSQEK